MKCDEKTKISLQNNRSSENIYVADISVFIFTGDALHYETLIRINFFLLIFHYKLLFETKASIRERVREREVG